MKTAICITGLLLLSWTHPGQAQGILGFFHQQARKKKLMLAQVAALTVFDHQHALGYLIEDRGLTDVHSQKDDELEAHESYYTSLRQVNAAMGAPEKRKLLHDYESRIANVFSSEISWQQKHALLKKNELSYLIKVAEGVRQQSQADSIEMQVVTTPGKLQLTDAERLARMDRLLAAMKDKYAFTMSFTGKCRKLAMGRSAQLTDREHLKKLYGN